MLPWKREPIWADTTFPKDLTVVMEPFKRSVEGIKRIFGENILACDVTEVKECIKGLNDVRGDVTFKCMDEDLIGISMQSVAVKVIPYLHQHLGVITRPLLEIPPLLKPSEPRKEQCQCDAVRG